jgi:ABC-type branched-subunit amino acid transport system permease subunit
MKGLRWLIGTLLVLVAIDFALPRLLNPYLLQIVMLCGINVILAVSLNLINGFTGQFSIGHAGFMALGAYGSAMFSLHVGARWVAKLPASDCRSRSPPRCRCWWRCCSAGCWRRSPVSGRAAVACGCAATTWRS